MSTVDDAGVTSTFSGCVSMEFAKVSISGGIVAEKKRVCRFAGNNFNMRRISCMNPMSSIRSASSNTKNSSAFRLMKPWLTRSCSRPGVATSICTPRFSSSVCGFLSYTAEDDGMSQSGILTICTEAFSYLYGQLAGRRQNECFDTFAVIRFYTTFAR